MDKVVINSSQAAVLEEYATHLLDTIHGGNPDNAKMAHYGVTVLSLLTQLAGISLDTFRNHPAIVAGSVVVPAAPVNG